MVIMKFTLRVTIFIFRNYTK